MDLGSSLAHGRLVFLFSERTYLPQSSVKRQAPELSAFPGVETWRKDLVVDYFSEGTFEMKPNAVSWAALCFSAAALIGSWIPSPTLTAKQEIPAAGQATARELSQAFNAVAGAISPSVVQINVQKEVPDVRSVEGGREGGKPGEMDEKQMEEMLRRFFERGGRFEKNQFASGTGSGFVYDDKGHVLTNNHVVEGARDQDIVVTFQDGSRSSAKVVGTFPEADVAVIKLADHHYQPATIGTSKNLKVGDWVLAIGSPFGLSQTVTAGIISATERDNLGINRFESFIQTDASINPGNSGGPLVGMDGKVIGINSAIATATKGNDGIGFAIPIDMAVRLADKLIQKGKITPMMVGVQVEPLSRGLAKSLGIDTHTIGVLVDEVVPASPADKAGLKPGDVITSFDGASVRTREGLQYLVSTSDTGKAYTINFIRNGVAGTVSITPVDRESLLGRATPRNGNPPQPEPKPESATTQSNNFGLTVEPLTQSLARRFGYGAQFNGLVVTEVTPGSLAQKAGIEVGDLITKYVKDAKITPVASAEEFEQFIQKNDEVNLFLEDVNHRRPGGFKTLSKSQLTAD